MVAPIQNQGNVKTTVKGTVAKLNGVTLSDQSPVAWAVTVGVSPFARVFVLNADNAKLVLGKQQSAIGSSTTSRSDDNSGGPATLEITPSPSSNAKPVNVKGLTVMHRAPVPTPYLGSVVVTDRRWRWPYTHVHRSYNVRRRTGIYRFAEGQRIGISAPLDTFFYAAWSLKTSGNQGAGPNQGAPGAIVKDPKRWSALDILIDVISLVDGKAPIVDGNIQTRNRVGVESLELDEPGHSAIERVLGYLAGVDVYVDLNGRTHVFDRYEVGGETELIKKVGAPTDLGPLITQMDRSQQRPPKVVCLFDREHELRFDYTETSGTSDGTTGALPYDARYMENVMPLVPPHASGSYIGQKGTIGEGTWLTIQQQITLFEKMRSIFNVPSQAPVLSVSVLLQMWNSPGYLEARYFQPGTSPIILKWFQAFRQHFRSTFRINARWRDRVRSLRAYRVAVLDTVTGTRGDALAFLDYSVRLGVREQVKSAAAGNKDSLLIFKNCYARDDKQPWSADSALKDANPARARVTVLDEDQGVIHVQLLNDPYGDAIGSSPGIITGTNAPTGDPSNDGNVTGSFAELSGNFSCSILLTATAAAPNDVRRLYAVEVKYTEHDDGKKTLGPIKYSRISSGMTAVRFAWSDDDKLKKAIDGSFGADSTGLSDDLDPLIVNQDEIQTIATAEEQRIQLLYRDRPEGVHEGLMDGSINQLKGGVTAIAWTLNPDGTCLMRLEIPPIVSTPDLYALLPEGIRRKIYHVLPP